MAKTKINSIKELPDWYDISKYDGFKNLGLIGWYKALEQRAFYIANAEASIVYDLPLLNSKVIQAPLKKLREDPLFVPKDKKTLQMFGGQMLTVEKCEKDHAKHIFAVAPLTLRKLFGMSHLFKNETQLRALECINKKTYFEDIDRPAYDVLKEEMEQAAPLKKGYLSRSSDLIEINLSLSDKILIEQFEIYLRETRKKRQEIISPNLHKRPSTHKWFEFGVIPYIDLIIWAKEERIHLPYRIIADAIFPDNYEKAEETVRKTTRNWAETILSEPYLSSLALLVAEELFEEN